MARPRYQVFVSSTFADLHEERQAVTWEVLKLRHIPAGMENFPATDDRGWKIVQRTIDDSDYYLLLIGGRYGTVDESLGISWTEREYDYAREKGVPVLAFVREKSHITQDKVDGGAEQLAAFVKKVADAHHKSGWTTKEDLTGKVVQALTRAIQDDEDDGTRRAGWSRGGTDAAEVTRELARLSKENSDLRSQLEAATANAKKNRAELSMTFDAESGDGDAGLLFVIPNYTLAAGSPGRDLVPVQATGPENIQLQNKSTYVRRAARTVWISGKVHNTGAAIARNIKVKLTARTRVEEVHIGEFERTYMTMSRPAYPEPRLISTSEDVHVLTNSLTVGAYGEIEQRIRSVGVRHDERLVRVGFTLEELKGIDAVQFLLEYSATSELGEHGSGAVTATVRRGEVVLVPTNRLGDL